MSNRTWTDDQLDAINAREGTLIVSAAAGSGKTSVLIERIIKRLTDEENPCNANELLIVTFTKAATAEMRSRLGKAIREKLKQDKDNEHLQRQQMLLPSANIFTIDAFCGNIVRENFESLGIAPDYEMLDENESKVLQKQALETVIESLYEEDSSEFKALVELLFCGRDDSSIEDNILKLYTYSRAYPSPIAWLKKSADMYNVENAFDENNKVAQSIKNNTEEYLLYIKGILTNALEELEIDFANSSCIGVLDEELNLCNKIIDSLNDFDFDNCLELTKDISFPKWPSPTGEKDNPIILHAKIAHQTAKDAFEKNGQGLRKYLCETTDELKDDLELLSPIANKLIEATLRFDEEFMRLKTEKNAYDFADIEHFALKLLVEDCSSKEIIKTKLAKDISENFTEILIDEYQDTNMAQDMIFRAISKDENNLFMVGDVKQSIYGFRQAMPEIFLQKRKSYTKYNRNENKYPAYVTLGKNFRSRNSITSCINFIFSQIMSEECGNVNYDDNEKLVYGASYEPSGNEEVELNILKTTSEDNNLEKEADFIAKYITNKVENESESYGDFVILMQTQSKRAPIIEKVLKDYGIPVYTEAGAGFLNTPDILTIVSLLKAIDNPLNDIPLMSVMLSSLFSFTPDDIARLRINKRDKSLYSSVLLGEKSGDEKCIYLCTFLRKYRRLSISLPAGELIREIYDETLFPEIVSALPNGAQRNANLQLFKQYADTFDNTNTFGISSFVRYIDKLSENDVDPASASTAIDSKNTVRIMSIHKSKGLEFKYCILADTTKLFNKMDLAQNLILHPEFGMGIKGRNLNTGNTYPSLIHTAVKMESKSTLMSETLRVLYVALTRAKENLIIVASTKSDEQKLADKALSNINGKEPINPYIIKNSTSFFDWLLLAFIRHPNAKALRDFSTLPSTVIPSDFSFSLNIIDTAAPENEVNKDEPLQFNAEDFTKEEKEIESEITSRLSYVYPYLPLANIATKRAASLNKDEKFDTKFFAKAIPEFLGTKGLTPAQRGTCLHKFMQYADLQAAANDFELEKQRLNKLGFLTDKELNAVDPNKVINFVNSNIAKRLFKSTNIMREKKFSILVPASTYDPDLPKELGNESVLIQGIADCVFEENNKLIIIDYKTDNTKDETELINRHKEQLTTYAEALTECIGKPVSEAYIYAFSLDKEIKIL